MAHHRVLLSCFARSSAASLSYAIPFAIWYYVFRVCLHLGPGIAAVATGSSCVVFDSIEPGLTGTVRASGSAEISARPREGII